MSGFKSDHQIIRDYVTAMDHLQYTQLPEDVVAIHLTHSNLPTKHVDIRLNLHMTIYEVKEKFRTHIGTSPEYQRLFLKDNGQTLYELSDNTKKLGFYSPHSGQEIFVLDTDPFSLSKNGGLSDVSLVQKYKMSDEDYEKRSGTMREWIRDQKKKNPTFSLVKKDPSQETEPKEIPNESSVAGIEVNMRCEVQPGARRGVVMFVGEIAELGSGGYWVGVKFDEPLGTSNGMVKGKVIFECPEGFGAFVRGHNVKVGDYPEKDIFEDSEDEI